MSHAIEYIDREISKLKRDAKMNEDAIQSHAAEMTRAAEALKGRNERIASLEEAKKKLVEPSLSPYPHHLRRYA